MKNHLVEAQNTNFSACSSEMLIEAPQLPQFRIYLFVTIKGTVMKITKTSETFVDMSINNVINFLY